MAARTKKLSKAAPSKTLEQTLWEAADKMRGNLEAPASTSTSSRASEQAST